MYFPRPYGYSLVTSDGMKQFFEFSGSTRTKSTVRVRVAVVFKCNGKTGDTHPTVEQSLFSHPGETWRPISEPRVSNCLHFVSGSSALVDKLSLTFPQHITTAV